MNREAKQKIFNENIGLIHKVIIDNFKILRLEHDELFQEGCVALLEAINRFDESKGIKFSTYAYKTILYKLSMFINTKIYQRKKTSIKKDGKFKTGYIEAEITSIYSKLNNSICEEESFLIDILGENDINFEVKETEIEVDEILETIKELEEKNKSKVYRNIYKVVVLKYQGYTNYEIGEMLGVSHTAVQNRFNIARDYIRGLSLSVAN